MAAPWPWAAGFGAPCLPERLVEACSTVPGHLKVMTSFAMDLRWVMHAEGSCYAGVSRSTTAGMTGHVCCRAQAGSTTR